MDIKWRTSQACLHGLLLKLVTFGLILSVESKPELLVPDYILFNLRLSTDCTHFKVRLRRLCPDLSCVCDRCMEAEADLHSVSGYAPNLGIFGVPYLNGTLTYLTSICHRTMKQRYLDIQLHWRILIITLTQSWYMALWLPRDELMPHQRLALSNVPVGQPPLPDWSCKRVRILYF